MRPLLCVRSVKIFDDFRHWRIENFYPFTEPIIMPFTKYFCTKG